MHKPDGRPQVVAHRGSSMARAEHTLAAYVQAIEDGADALECDVRLTADGHLVCVHDRRVDRTTNARGLVSTMRLEQLSDLDAASWKSPWADLDDESVEVDEEFNRVLTLARLIEVVRDYDRVLELAIETKHPTRYAGMVERTLVDMLWKHGWTGAGAPVRVMSMSGVALTRVRRLAPEMEVVLLIEGQSWKVTRQALGDDWIAGPGIEQLKDKPKLGRRLREDGRRIHVWTVNTEADLQICLDLGAEAVITDIPDRVLSWLA
ncbi:glycerophosphodiester phosphodiesterase [Nocardioides marmoribigeumensis]|uniref:Glycerophosphoryl diester phosphodiesterase n=1 Tax=Nocardioides marmoribigeumensis TaxID=433649 RepID=A0ABU2BU88_9ACTN|nr:glycerophosphodiester phosphodiesterase family protein [Nocardioides marmoribigeumensis]MDR7362195.1 glycerophosphoryl diester phosphodiesterase [Nocardioides marmoribigeumensis]